MRIAFSLDGKKLKWLAIGLVAGVAVGAPVWVSAGGTGVPHTFAAGEVVSAAKFNANFSALATALDELQTPPSMIRVRGGASGFGSTGSAVRRFTEVISTVGSAVTYTPDAVSGDRFTINVDGVYSMTYVDKILGATSAFFAITLNSSNLGTAFASAADPERLVHIIETSHTAVGTTVFLRAGDVIRAQAMRNNGSDPFGTELDTRFTITRVGN